MCKRRVLTQDIHRLDSCRPRTASLLTAASAQKCSEYEDRSKKSAKTFSVLKQTKNLLYYIPHLNDVCKFLYQERSGIHAGVPATADLYYRTAWKKSRNEVCFKICFNRNLTPLEMTKGLCGSLLLCFFLAAPRSLPHRLSADEHTRRKTLVMIGARLTN